MSSVKVRDTLWEMALDQHGFVTAREAAEAGLERSRLPEMARRGTLERISRGVYRFRDFPAGPHDQLMAATLWPEGAQGVLCHESALDLYDVCDINPGRIHISVPARYRIRRRRLPDPLVVHHRDLPADAVTVFEGIPTVTLAQAIRDEHAAHGRVDLLEQAIDEGRRRGLLVPAEALVLREEIAMRSGGGR